MEMGKMDKSQLEAVTHLAAEQALMQHLLRGFGILLKEWLIIATQGSG